MKWSTLSLEKVSVQSILQNLKWIIGFSTYDLLLTSCVPTGEPHIDGEPGDLRFRIKVLKYEEASFAVCRKNTEY